MKWEIIKNKTADHWIELKGTDGGLTFDSPKDKVGKPIWNYYAVCKWDGCIDLRTYANGYSYDHECSDDCQCCEDYIHICDLDNFIKDLGDMKKVGVEFFKGKSGEEYWKPTNQQSLDKGDK